MARTRRSAEQARETLLEAAEQYVRLRPGALVIVTRGEVEIVRQSPPAAPLEGVSAYDAAILTALTDNALSPKRVARTAGHRFNSYFRERLGKLVDANLVRRTRRGYQRP
jgi:hypothetical protein